MSEYRILLVEDEANLLAAIKLNLELEGYHVSTATDGKKALKMIKEERVSLFLTARNTSEDRVLGLKKGADDYLSKPFNLEELILRVGLLIKRGSHADHIKNLDQYQIGDKTILFASYEIKAADGTITPLTKKESMLLKLLIERKGEAVSRELILETVWNYDVYPSTRTIDNFILSFRKHFEKDLKHPQYFHSIRGVGYKFTDS